MGTYKGWQWPEFWKQFCSGTIRKEKERETSDYMVSWNSEYKERDEYKTKKNGGDGLDQIEVTLTFLVEEDISDIVNLS